MTFSTIPDWTPNGLIPPINALTPTSVDRSPYTVSLTDLIIHFSTSPERIQILDGLLRYREALHKSGLICGFQWLDGSFLENIESLEGRNPGDIDVVTYYHLPTGKSQFDLLQAQPATFDHGKVKAEYHVDSFFVQLSSAAPESLVERSAYWYSVWSHRRDGIWKGFLQIDLAPNEDTVAMVNLNVGMVTGGTS